MPVYNVGSDVFHTEAGRLIWSTQNPAALLLPEAAVSIANFDIGFPDFDKSNAYGLDVGSSPFGGTITACASFSSIDPQEWDSGLGFVCNLPPSANYFEVEIDMFRTMVPSTYRGEVIPGLLSGNRHMPDGGSFIVERIGPIVRIARFEKSGSAVYLRRKQSVTNAGNQGIWTPGNAIYDSAGGKLEGFTYGGSPNAWPAYMLDARTTGSVNKARGESNACSLADTSNYATNWRGTVTITPGYIKP